MKDDRFEWQDDMLWQPVRERYEHPEEVAAYAKEVEEGLRPEEEVLIGRFCPPPGPVLDIGCGAGREAIALARMGYQVTGVDISLSMLEQARTLAAARRLPIAWIHMPHPLHLPVPDNSFPYVLGLAQLMSQIPGRKNRVVMWREIRRVLTADGIFLGTIADRQAAADLMATGSTDEDEVDEYDEEAGEKKSIGREETSEVAVEGKEESPDLFPSPAALPGWEEGDIWVWQPSAAALDIPLRFHLHTRGELTWELKAAGGLYLYHYDELPAAGKSNYYTEQDRHRYRYIVIGRKRSMFRPHLYSG
ncbi:MAG TPA: class I SAM-dependent methyltransferase [Firmicutes bacterium]|nr:class I SAM-dependent methyltransferase [Bacillota bacterium]